MLRNYHDISFILNMELPDFIGLFLRLKERELERMVWEMWLAKFPFMDQESYVSYEEMLAVAKQAEATPEGDTVHGAYVDQVLF